ncbi:S-layer homology domain-containing protein [Cohnella sp. GCM10012308]|uniref:S-layer homology domain-containing protein n=1 Tax=Cohnella sp. GCM10012308 TaxID=3317329 RepID=UPI003614B0C8
MVAWLLILALALPGLFAGSGRSVAGPAVTEWRSIAGDMDFDRPSGIARDADGTIYAVDSGRGVIKKRLPGANEWTVISGEGDFSYPNDLAAGGGDLYALDNGNSLRLMRLASGQTEWTEVAGTNKPSIPGNSSIAVAGDGRHVYWSFFDTVYVYDVDADSWSTIDASGLNAMIADTAVDANGTLYLLAQVTSQGFPRTTTAGLYKYENGNWTSVAAGLTGNVNLAIAGTDRFFIAPSASTTLLSTSKGVYEIIDGAAKSIVPADGAWVTTGGLAVDSEGYVYAASIENSTVLTTNPNVPTAPAAKGSWVPVGGFRTPADISAHWFGLGEDNTPIAAYGLPNYSNRTQSTPPSVQAYDGNGWSAYEATADFTYASTTSYAIGPDGRVYIAVPKSDSGSYKLYIYVNGGSGWQPWGDPATVATTNMPSPKIAFDREGALYMTYVYGSGSDYHLVVQKDEGNGWVQVDSLPFTVSQGAPVIAAGDADHVYIAVRNFNLQKVAVYRVDPNGLTLLSGGLLDSISTPGTAMALEVNPLDGAPYVFVADQMDGNKGRVYAYRDGSWNAVGNRIDSLVNFTSLAFAPDGTPYVSYTDSGKKTTITVLKLADGSWQAVGPRGVAPDYGIYYFNRIVVSSEGIPYVSYFDQTNGLKVYRYQPPAPVLAADTTDNDPAHDIVITFTDNPDWRGSITNVLDGGVSVTAGTYTLGAGTLTFAAGELSVGSHQITLTSSKYADATVAQTVTEEATPTPSTSPSPTPDDSTPSPSPDNSTPSPSPDAPTPSPDNSTPTPSPTYAASPTPSPSATTGVEVLVNGKVEQAGTATTGVVDGRTVTKVTIDEAKLIERLAAEGERAVVTIPVKGGSDAIVGELNGRMVQGMEDKQAVIRIRTALADYTIPAAQIDIGAIAAKLGADVKLQDIVLRIEIAAPAAGTAKSVENAASKDGFTLVAQPLEFSIHAVYGGQTLDVSSFNSYVERSILLPDHVDPGKITTGIVVEQDGSVRHVPTKVVTTDGRYYAQVNSLTNSTYAVVWHPLTFADAVGHWAEAAVNDMGSRMIVDGTGAGQFQPDRNVTRAEFAAMIVRGLGLKPEAGSGAFSDVKAADWYAGAIGAAVSQGLIQGYEDGTFRPTASITREQAMTIVAKALAITGLKAKLPVAPAADILSAFVDASSVSDWASGGLADAVQAGLISGRGQAGLAPQASITRAEVATLMQRLLQKSDLI